MRRIFAYITGVLFALYMGLAISNSNLPFPSSMFTILLVSNMLAALAAIFLPKLTLYFYEGMVYHKERSLNLNIARIGALIFFSLNYYVQNILYRLPWYFSRPLSILFFCLLFIQVVLIDLLFTF
ncbi:hypothetical protein [Bacillus sp. SJS]|uniref:hypothetical protein n=1 Tax=Bacillus sp. SJS TaxID=1423321 RepID=UPI0004DD7867|nr:hypothetical protein [Bacillus sp. SJS]KZZ84972.1 hypothetical protein AS29_007930 [Bacillus sp. SJS]